MVYSFHKQKIKYLRKCFLSELAAEFLTRPQNLEVLEGDKAEFVCSVSKEAITVQWLRGDTVLEPGDKYDIISDGKKRTLVVKDSILGDAGKYTVMVGEVKATARLTVIGKLYFVYVQLHILFHSLYYMMSYFFYFLNFRKTQDYNSS